MAVIALLAAGLVAGRAAKEPGAAPQPQIVRADHLEFLRPRGWRMLRPGPSVPGVQEREQVAVGPAGDRRTAIVAAMTEPGGDGPLPDALAARVPAGSQKEPVKIGDVSGVRIRNLRAGDDDRTPMTVFAVPTSAGTAIFACLGAAGTGASPICEDHAATLRLVGARALPLQPTRRYAEVVQRTFDRLNAARERGLDDLRSARTPAQQAQAAESLSTAYAAAAGGLREVRGRSFAPEAANISLAAALHDVATSYDAMAEAAGRESASRYATARRAVVSGERQVTAALRRLQEVGYQVQSP